ncbi:MAG TPA: TfoX/Sxy family protein [Candidatus Aquicultoraceae bacterium]|nr:TfoX/Sxy family protein [Candidatus Aquicultoraceae bacterium]
MRKRDSFRDFVLDQLGSLEGVSCRSMFGGYGLYLGPDFFAIVYDGRLYFRTDEATREKYRSLGMGPFAPSATQVLRTYYEVPEEVVEDGDELASWAREAASRPPGRGGSGPPPSSPSSRRTGRR